MDDLAGASTCLPAGRTVSNQGLRHACLPPLPAAPQEACLLVVLAHGLGACLAAPGDLGFPPIDGNALDAVAQPQVELETKQDGS